MKGNLSPEQVKDLVEKATGNSELADRTAAQYVLDSTRNQPAPTQ